MRVFVMFLAVFVATAASIQAQTWDVLDETYGNGEGQISFLNSYLWPWGTTQPTEVLYDGYAVLTHDATGIDYAARENGTINLPSTTWQMDMKLKLNDALGFSFYLGDTDAPPRSIVQVNALFDETVAHPNTISDYGIRIVDDGEIQPAGFDGSAVHVYSFRMHDGSIDIYLDDAFLATLINGAGVDGGYEACEFGFGANLSHGPGTSEVYYVKISSTLAPPPPARPGDANRDRVVDAEDAAFLAANWLKIGEATWEQGDFNEDGNVNDIDAAILAANWSPAPASSSVPEPSSICLLLIGCLGLMFFRRRFC